VVALFRAKNVDAMAGHAGRCFTATVVGGAVGKLPHRHGLTGQGSLSCLLPLISSLAG
jgi:hypothetical protein